MSNARRAYLSPHCTVKTILYHQLLYRARLSYLERLHHIRSELGLSSRALSLQLKLSPNAWSLYEQGKVAPSTAVYFALAQMNVNLNWLIVGDGAMWCSEQATPEFERVIRRQEQRQIDSLGLGRLTLLAERGDFAKRLKLLVSLAAAHPQVVSLERLGETTGIPTSQLPGLLVELIEAGFVHEEPTGFSAPSVVLAPALDSPDRAQLTLGALHFVLDAVSKAATDPGAAVLLDGTACVKDAQAYLRDVVEHIRDFGNAQHDPDGQSVRIVLAAMKDPL